MSHSILHSAHRLHCLSRPQPVFYGNGQFHHDDRIDPRYSTIPPPLCPDGIGRAGHDPQSALFVNDVPDRVATQMIPSHGDNEHGFGFVSSRRHDFTLFIVNKKLQKLTKMDDIWSNVK